MILKKIEREFERFKKKLLYSSKAHKQLEKSQHKLNNMPYELYDKIRNDNFSVPLPIIKTAEETLDKLLQAKCSLSRFGDGEFVLMGGGRIHYQGRSPELAQRLKKVIASDIQNLLIALPPCFGSLDKYLPPVAYFWIKWASRKRDIIYSYLDMNRVYYDAFFSRVYMQCYKTNEHYKRCGEFYEKVKNIWAGRDIVICEGEGTRFGMFNDLLDGAASISRILCPARNAFDKYDEILSAFNGISPDKLILAALGPTATVLSYDLCSKGYQAIDIGALDMDYEWFLRKEVELGAPLEFKYVDSGKKGRKIRPLEDPEYNRQIIKRII
jgi:glycosyltransferase family protein